MRTTFLVYITTCSFLLLAIACNTSSEEDLTAVSKPETNVFPACPFQQFTAFEQSLSNEKRDELDAIIKIQLSDLSKLLQKEKGLDSKLELIYNHTRGSKDSSNLFSFMETTEAVTFNMFNQFLCNLWNLKYSPNLSTKDQHTFSTLLDEKILDLANYMTSYILNLNELPKPPEDHTPKTKKPKSLEANFKWVRILLPAYMENPLIRLNDSPITPAAGSGSTIILLKVPTDEKHYSILVKKGQYSCHKEFQLDQLTTPTLSFINCSQN